MNFNEFKALIIEKNVDQFLAAIANINHDEFDINQRESLVKTEHIKDKVSEKTKTITEKRGLLHYLIDADNVPMLQAFLALPQTNYAIQLSIATQTQVQRHQFFTVKSGVAPTTEQILSPTEYASSKRRTTMLAVLQAAMANTASLREQPSKRFKKE